MLWESPQRSLFKNHVLKPAGSQNHSGFATHGHTKLRRLACDVLVGKHKYASSWIALQFLSDRVFDPLFYVIVSAVCTFRRLFYYHSVLASEMYILESSTTVRGPCSALAKYFQKVSWTPLPNGIIQTSSGHEVDLRHQSTHEIRKILREAWSTYVWSQVSHRKGIIDVPFDFFTQHKVLGRLSDTTLQLIALNITGGFQTGAVKQLWDSTQSIACPFCGMDDTHSHRLLECASFQHVRDQHPEAIRILRDFPNLQYFPIATTHSMQIIYNRLKLCRTGPFLDHPNFADTDHLHLWTDGPCDRPKDLNCCRAAWAVVQQASYHPSDPSFHDFVVVQAAHVSGNQSINRGELGSVEWISRTVPQLFPSRPVDIYSDSAFTVRIVQAIASPHLNT